jgi:type II secretory ATPase GspE/PulE/Tfp pilus assembly ATPase PilB-like protein
MLQEMAANLLEKWRKTKVTEVVVPQVELPSPAPSVATKKASKAPSSISDEDLKVLMASSFDVLTAPGGPVAIAEAHRETVALLSTGVALVATDDLLLPLVIEAVRQARSKGFMIKKAYRVAREDLVNLYYTAQQRVEGRQTETSKEDLAKTLITLGEIILRAVELDSTDVHINRFPTECEIRIRQLGAMRLLMKVSIDKADAMLVAAFNAADSSDATYNQYEGQAARVAAIKLGLPEFVQSLRLQYNPLYNGGRQLVIRILTVGDSSANADVDTLGYSDSQVRSVRIMRRRPIGINIISGPTGSGKSTTLQRSLIAAMREKNHEISVITIEDPTEYLIPGAAQVTINNVKTQSERAAAFTKAMSDALRSDPDVIMIGEIRDHASADLAFEAAMSGHQVWASLHANSASEILDRLRDLGTDLFKLTNPGLVSGLVGQRLARTLCPHCKQPARAYWDPKHGVLDDILLEELDARLPDHVIDKIMVARPGGCSKCVNGASGRTVVAEIIRPDEGFMEKVHNQDRPGQLDYWFDHLEGQTALEHALAKMIMGNVDPREIEAKVAPIRELREGRLEKVMIMNKIII